MGSVIAAAIGGALFAAIALLLFKRKPSAETKPQPVQHLPPAPEDVYVDPQARADVLHALERAEQTKRETAEKIAQVQKEAEDARATDPVEFVNQRYGSR